MSPAFTTHRDNTHRGLGARVAAHWPGCAAQHPGSQTLAVASEVPAGGPALQGHPAHVLCCQAHRGCVALDCGQYKMRSTDVMAK
eukprot:1149343-Pelagomonas_calceolata.AAC.9